MDFLFIEYDDMHLIYGACNGNGDEAALVKDGHYFLSILDKQATRLLGLADQAEKELDQEDLPEEAKGYLRSASGKAKLLVSQKMQQFRGLCTNNIKQVEGEAFPTTNEDLQGFWDMIMLQVDQIDTLFKELDKLRANNWQEEKPPVTTNGSSVKPKKVVKSNRPISATAEENRKIREAQRKKMLEERRKAMREQQNKPTRQSIEIFVPESS
ncbi:disks large-associated protein dap sap90/psd-95-associated protein [Holotrichia oblita]|uniref:Disks large-associated protein dap sap90/psd-95-associated protein n=1 Tax=Holotrichia oblita TaxID=644536 RepID=A0ACB9TNT1_HOLOL|nr:disks large-associated protein dap sap90/psd-95-associated protein [Holotrichia oblita]